MAIDMDEQLFRQKHGWSMWLHSGQATTVTPGANEATERLFVTHVFLVDPESADGQGVVVASVQIGTRKTMLATLSSETPCVALKTPVELDAEFCFDVMPPGGDYETDTDPVVVEFQGYALPSASTKGEIEKDDDGKEDIINNVNHEEDEEEGDAEATEDDEDATSPDYMDYDSRDDGAVWGLPLGTVIDDWPRRDDSNGEVGRRAATPKSNGAGGNGRRRRRRKRFVAEGEGRSFGVPVRSPQFDIHGEHRRRVPPEAVVLGIFVFLYLIAMVAVFIHG
jgi:hypothetical protein